MQPSGGQPPGRQLHYGTLYPPSPSGHGQQSYHRPMSDFSLGNVSTRVPSSEAGEGLGVGQKSLSGIEGGILNWEI